MELLHIQHYLNSLGSSHDTTVWIKNKQKNNSKLKETEKKSYNFFLWFFHFFHNAVSITSRKEYDQWSKEKTAYSKAVHLLLQNLLHRNSFLWFTSNSLPYLLLLLCLQCIIRSFSSSLWHSSGSMNSSLLY